MSVFEQMLSRAYDGRPPAELANMLEEVKRLVRKVAEMRFESIAEQRKLEGLESRGRDGRQRFGFAVDALGVDASKARDEARAARTAVAPFSEKVSRGEQAVLTAHHGDLDVGRTQRLRRALQGARRGLRAGGLGG